MSALKCLLSSASRQYTCLVRNTFSVQRHVPSSGLCMSRCLRTDDIKPSTESTKEVTPPPTTDDIKATESSEEVTPPRSKPKGEFKKKAPFITLSEDYRPGGPFIPTDEVYDRLVDGVRYDELPRIYIRASMQNTVASASVHGKGISSQSGGTVGFKNAKKKTNVCGQTVGLAVGMDLLKRGYKNACIVVKGIGAGRLPAIKGVQLAGVNIVAITDRTYQNASSRPSKPRRV